MNQHIPQVFVIGAMKSGTTSFYDIYFKHPDIHLTKAKEHNGFIRFNGLADIADSYKGDFGTGPGLRCDISPKYSQRHLFPDTAEKIFKLQPEAKIIYLVRDPIERFISHVYHDVLRDRISAKGVGRILDDLDNTYIKTSLYFYQLEPYISFFENRQILVLNLSDLRVNKKGVEEQLASFLGLPAFKFRDGKSYTSDQRYKIFFFDSIHKWFGEGRITKFYHLLFFLLGVKPKKPKLMDDDLAYLRSVFEKDINNLCDSFGVDTNAWTYFTSK